VVDTAIRQDKGSLAAPISGTLFEGRAGRVHGEQDPLMYTEGPEYRTIEDLQTIASQLDGKPFTLLHPDGLISDGAKADIIGHVVAGRIEDGHAIATIMVTSEAGLKAIRTGTYALSLGYRRVLDSNRYQRNIHIDHLSLVPRGRCNTCVLRADCVDGDCRCDKEPMKIGELEVPINIVVNDADKLEDLLKNADSLRALLDAMSMNVKTKCPDCGEVYSTGSAHTCAKADQVSEPVKSCTCKNHTINHNNGEHMSDLNDDKAKLDAATAELATLKSRVTELEIEATNARKDADALKVKLDAAVASATQTKTDAEASVAQAKAEAAEVIKNEIDAKVKARVGLIVEASKFDLKDAEGTALKLDALSDREIKCAVIKHVDGDDVPADKADAFVDGVYSGSLKRGAAASGSRETARTVINEMRKDGGAAPKVAPTGRAAELEAKDKMKRASANAWTKTSNE
jgi:hypothetical protein